MVVSKSRSGILRAVGGVHLRLTVLLQQGLLRLLCNLDVCWLALLLLLLLVMHAQAI